MGHFSPLPLSLPTLTSRDVIPFLTLWNAQPRELRAHADVLAWMIEQAVEHQRMFSLLDRNRGAVRTLADGSDFFQDHEQWHDEQQPRERRGDE